MTTKKLWFGFLAVMTISFAVLLYYGREIYRQAPPIPDKVVTTSGTTLSCPASSWPMRYLPLS